MTDPFGVHHRVLILGATSDIAADLAIRLAERGTPEFILTARRPDGLRPLIDRLETLQARATPLAFDARETSTHAELIDGLWLEHGEIDLVVLAFGVLDDAGTETVNAVEVASVNYVGAVSALEAVTPRLVDQGRGSLVVLSSVAAERPRASNYVYASTKAGLDAYARGLGDALDPCGVHVLVVRPGFVHTKMTRHLAPGPMPIHPGDVSDAILRGLDKKRSVVWAPAAARIVMAGLRVLPPTLYRRLSRDR